MKRIIYVFLVAVCACVMAAPAQAQLLKWGVKGGLNMSKLDFKHLASSDNSTGFFIGPMAELTIPVVGLGLDAALMYSQRGGTYDVEGEHGSIEVLDGKQRGLEIPVNLKYTLALGSLLGVYVAVGPDFYFNFKDIEWEGLKANRTQVGLNIGAGLKLVSHLQVGVNYQIPLGDSFKFSEAMGAIGDEIVGNGKTKTWQMSLAYLF